MAYNGHKNWNHWNVSLWLSNDEHLYTMMRRFIRLADNRTEAVNSMFNYLIDNDMPKTPDGAKYNKSSIRAAMVGM